MRSVRHGDDHQKVKDIIDTHTEAWAWRSDGERSKTSSFPTRCNEPWPSRRRAEREKRAKIIAARGDSNPRSVGQAADIISQHPLALQLRNLQVLAESPSRRTQPFLSRRNLLPIESLKHFSTVRSRAERQPMQGDNGSAGAIVVKM